MKRVLAILFTLLCMASFAFSATMKEILEKASAADKAFTEGTGRIFINMEMKGSTMTVDSRMWKKNEKFRLESETTMPMIQGTMKMTTVFDGNAVYISSPIVPTISKIDVTRIPTEKKDEVINPPFAIEKILQAFSGSAGMEILPTQREGKKYYILETKEIGKLNRDIAKFATLPSIQKALVYIDAATFLPGRVEWYGEGTAPAMWMEMKDIKFAAVEDARFVIAEGSGAISDITPMILQFFSGEPAVPVPPKK
ncbi:MAG: hypothetical protein WDA18_04575 [Candidatus Ratteibacteria bacterium]